MRETLETLGLPLLHRLDPETAHGLAVKALQLRLAPQPGPVTSAVLQTELAGLPLPNPVGLAAGFDKNAQAITPLLQCGFGFIEIGAVTPHPQQGNPRPRLFRLTEDKAAINRFGFNNDGMKVVAARLATRPKQGVIGINLGANKDSADRAADYSEVLAQSAAHVDFATVNVSSPNTEKLRDLQGREALNALLSGVMQTRAGLARQLPVFLKIAPDLNEFELDDIVAVAAQTGIDGIIATNTTLARDGLHNVARDEKGGLSGAPLFEKSTRILAQLHLRAPDLPLIGVGGVSTAAQAYAKIRAGATAVQLYTALVFEGISLAARIARDLDALLARDGFTSVAQAVGTSAADYATPPE